MILMTKQFPNTKQDGSTWAMKKQYKQSSVTLSNHHTACIGPSSFLSTLFIIVTLLTYPHFKNKYEYSAFSISLHFCFLSK